MNRRADFSPEALAHVSQVETWWRASRPAAQELFLQELVAAVERVAARPSCGRPYPLDTAPDLLRILLPRTRYHVYYTVAAHEPVVRIHAVWHARRGSGPQLG